MLEFPKKQNKTSRLLRNTQQVSFPMYRSFGIIHVKCYVRLYLVFVFPKRQYRSKYGENHTVGFYAYLLSYIYNQLIKDCEYPKNERSVHRCLIQKFEFHQTSLNLRNRFIMKMEYYF